jgi:beta-glucanase (GH16 family)
MDPNDEWTLVFSDEFNTDGRTFYAGDDPYWEAVDLHYWGTVCPLSSYYSSLADILLYRQNDLEWYDPSQGEPFLTKAFSLVYIFQLATTQGGALRIKIERVADPTTNHNLQYRSAMVCFMLGGQREFD